MSTPNLWTSPTQFSTKNLQVVNAATINGQQAVKVDSSEIYLSSTTVLNVSVDSYTTSSSINGATPLIRTFNLIKYYNTSKIFIDAWLNVRKAPGDTNWPTYLRCDLKSVGGLITYASRTILFFVEARDVASSIANVKFYFDTTTRTAPAGQYVVEFYAGRASNTANTVVFLINSPTYSAGSPTNPASTFVYYEIE